MTKHLVLLGDSIFDNGVYVEAGQADVTTHLRRKLELLGWTLDMRAVDGAVASSVEGQLTHSPVVKRCTFVLSVGGNDALTHLNMVTEAPDLLAFYEIREAFRDRYAQALDLILGHGQPLISVPHPCADHHRKSRPAPEGGGSVPHLSTHWPIAATPHHRNLPANQSLCPWRTSESVRLIDSDF